MNKHDKNMKKLDTEEKYETVPHHSANKLWFFHFPVFPLSHCVTCVCLCVFCLSLWRWTIRLWLVNLSHRLAPQSSHTTILWRPATSVSSPPTVSRVSGPHLVKILSYRHRASFFSDCHLEINIFWHCPHWCLLAPDLAEWFHHPKVDCVVTNECQTLGIRWCFSCCQSSSRRHVSQWDLSSWNLLLYQLTHLIFVIW